MIQTLFGGPKKASIFERISDKMAQAVEKTKDNLVSRVDDLLKSRKEISPELLKELETLLISADIGPRTAAEIVTRVREEAEKQQTTEPVAVRETIKRELIRILESTETKVREVPDGQPFVILTVGVNGTGKTTTIGKLTQRYRTEGNTVLLCAADTFRAAAIEQLEVWGQRTGTEVIRQKPGADPSAVLYDALAAAKAPKMRRTAEKLIPGAPHETLLVLDATTGQNGLQQARQFTQASGVTGLVITKLDGTARGGIVVAIARELGLPVRYVGTGEKIDDLIPFDPRQFVDSLFGNGRR